MIAPVPVHCFSITFYLKETTGRPWGSNPGPLDPESDALPLGHLAPVYPYVCIKDNRESLVCVIEIVASIYRLETSYMGTLWKNSSCIFFSELSPLVKFNSPLNNKGYNFVNIMSQKVLKLKT